MWIPIIKDFINGLKENIKIQSHKLMWISKVMLKSVLGMNLI